MPASGSAPDFRLSRWHQTPATTKFAPAQRLRDEHAARTPGEEKPLAELGDPIRTVPTEVSFGPFRLLPDQFLLLEDGKPAPLGSRAMEILIALLERPGELISKQKLMARVWPDVFVAPANLTVHISALRRMLRDGRDGNRFIINIPGRGYKFVASVAGADHAKTPPAIVRWQAPGEGWLETVTFSDSDARNPGGSHSGRSTTF